MTFGRAATYGSLGNLRLQSPCWLDMVFSVAMGFDRGSLSGAAEKNAANTLSLPASRDVERKLSQVVENKHNPISLLDTFCVELIPAVPVVSIPA